jgi:hypothetical protein
METSQLKAYYDQKQKEYRAHLDAELKQFKDANNNYLSAVIAQACENAKNLLETSNQKAFERFRQSQTDIENKIKENYPKTLLTHIAKSVKNDLDRSLEFNQSLFEKSIAYYKRLKN